MAFRDMINWCIQHPLKGKALKLDDPTMIAMEAYALYERRGVKLAPGKHKARLGYPESRGRAMR